MICGIISNREKNSEESETGNPELSIIHLKDPEVTGYFLPGLGERMSKARSTNQFKRLPLKAARCPENHSRTIPGVSTILKSSVLRQHSPSQCLNLFCRETTGKRHGRSRHVQTLPVRHHHYRGRNLRHSRRPAIFLRLEKCLGLNLIRPRRKN